MAQNESVYIVSYARTPVGAFRGALSSLPATKLQSIAIKEAVNRAGISVDDVDEVILGQVLQAGCGQTPGRQAAIGAGLSQRVPCTVVNKVCASGMKAIAFASQSLALGDVDVIVAGGMESMSNAPFVVPRGEIPYGGLSLVDVVVNDGLTDTFNNCHMGQCAEQLAAKYEITRAQQDEYAKTSYTRCLKSITDGVFAKEIVSVSIPGKRGKPATLVEKDEEPEKVDFDRLATLNPVFIKGTGTITAANASSLNDGAAALVLMSSKAVAKFGVKPLAKIVSYADAAVAPVDFGIAPAYAMPKALEKAGINKDQIAQFEINEAFSAVALANLKELGLDANKVNVNGGAVGLGHPLGMSGARIVGTLALNLTPGEYGLAGVCNGGGGASAMLIQKL
uniref:acetyl-CoA C-acetyltransferase n=1 Tax=Eotetranychus kankitus TaxID=2137873 RepID=A0A5P9NZH6_9ACAR|nr:AACT3 [Eotetranychus kankitus]